jgi:Domain of unknown function (DUF4259)
MGTWSGEPFGNDTAADWAWELDGEADWDIVLNTLTTVLDKDPATVDAELATIVIAAAEVAAHQLGRATQSDAYTESVSAFVARAPEPPAGIVAVALEALDVATAPEGELAETWAEGDPGEWAAANRKIREALSAA